MRGLAIAVAALALAPGTAAAKGPSSIYAFAGGCFATAGTGSLYFKATGLGTYMLQDAAGKLVGREWRAIARGGGRYAFQATPDGAWLDGSGGTRFARRTGCTPFPEAEVGATGSPHAGRNRDGTVYGYADPHLHITANLRAGGMVIYGEPFDRFGIAEALGHDTRDHGPDGSLDITGNLLRDGVPVGTHDTHGWPTFAGWPTYDTITHQQTYYVWLQRAWLAGLRLVTAQLVEDAPLCNIEPLKSHSCDETATIALEAQELRDMQDYIDAQSGGPGRGWFRIVYSSRQARRVIERGKLAVFMGVESSDPFDCPQLLGQTPCTRASVDRGIALYRRLGIRGMFLAHWVDNAFGGAALEEGAKGTFIGAMEITQTGLPFATETCPEPGQGSSCNDEGLTELGTYLVQKLMDSHMLIEVDHLSERGRLQVLAMAEQRHYPLVSSHTDTGGIWTPADLKRLYALGGFASARPDTAAKLAQDIDSFRAYAPAGRFLGVGLGTDTGGFASSPGPDPQAGAHPLGYPFRSADGKVTFTRERTGRRVFDLNRDGVAHYGLYPDLLALMRTEPGGKEATRLLFRSAEAYLRTWQRAGD